VTISRSDAPATRFYVTTPAEPAVPDDRTAFAPVAPELVDYTGTDATIDTDGLRQLVADWARGTVSTAFLVDGIDAWASQRSVS